MCGGCNLWTFYFGKWSGIDPTPVEVVLFSSTVVAADSMQYVPYTLDSCCKFLFLIRVLINAIINLGSLTLFLNALNYGNNAGLKVEQGVPTSHAGGDRSPKENRLTWKLGKIDDDREWKRPEGRTDMDRSNISSIGHRCSRCTKNRSSDQRHQFQV